MDVTELRHCIYQLNSEELFTKNSMKQDRQGRFMLILPDRILKKLRNDIY